MGTMHALEQKLGAAFRTRPDAFFFLGLVLLAATLWTVCSFAVTPLRDFNEWTYQGYLLNRLAAGVQVPAILKTWPVPNSVSEIGLALLMTVSRPIEAAMIFIALYIVLAGLVMARASRTASGDIDGAKFVLLASLGVMHAPFWTGELNYQIGLLVFFFYVCRSKTFPPSAAQVAAYAVLLFFCHALCLGMFLVYEGFRSLRCRQIIRLAISLIPVAVLLLWYHLSDPRLDTAGLDNTPPLHGLTDWFSYSLYQLAKAGPYHNFIFGGIGDFERAPRFYWMGVAANLVFATYLGVLFLRWALHSLHTRAYSTEFLTAATLLIIGVFNIGALLGIAQAGERMIAPALLLTVLALPPKTLIARTGAMLSAVLLAVLLHFNAAADHSLMSGKGQFRQLMFDSKARFHILFWERPFLLAEPALYAEQDSIRGAPPQHPLMFQTSLFLLRRKAGTQP